MKKRTWVTGLKIAVVAAQVLTVAMLAGAAAGCGGGTQCLTPRAAPGRPVAARRTGPAARPARPATRTRPARLTALKKPLTVLQAARVVCRANRREMARIMSPRMSRPQVLQAIVGRRAEHRRSYGPCLGVKKLGEKKVLLVHGKMGITTRVILNAEGQLGGLWFGLVVPMKDSVAAVTRDLRALSGDVAISVRQIGGAAILRVNANKPLAVASAFKLSVLKAVVAEIKAGRLRWRDTVVLKPGPHPRPHFPMGFLPAGAVVTVESLATFMIARSDNAATDQLMARLGRRVIERHAPRRNRPLLTTVEMTKLKHPTFQTLADQFMRAKTVVQKRNILQLLTARKMPTARRRAKPRYIRELEWFYSTDELCKLIIELRSTRLFAAVQKMKRPAKHWARFAFKGGSEPGVVNLTYAMQHAKSKLWYCISATWNNSRKRVRRKKLRQIVGRMMRLLSQR